MNPELSVIIPTYNRKKMLLRALGSVLNQSFRDLEVIVVDDNSSDGTGDRVKALGDERIKYIRLEERKGAPHARNTGIKISSGRIIGFLDDDDEWLENKAARQIELLGATSKRTGLVYCGARVINDDTGNVEWISRPEARGDVSERLLLGPLVGGLCSVMVRKECFDEVGVFDESLRSAQDWDMWLRLAQEYHFDAVDDVLVTIHIHGEQISADIDRLIAGRERILAKHIMLMEERPDILIQHLKRMGKLYMIKKDRVSAIRWFSKTIKRRPLEIFKILLWCLVELPSIRSGKGGGASRFLGKRVGEK